MTEKIDENYESPPNSTTSGPIFLFKENNVTSEQTFVIAIDHIDIFYDFNTSRATYAVDYLISDDSLLCNLMPQSKGSTFHSHYFPITFRKALKLFFSL